MYAKLFLNMITGNPCYLNFFLGGWVEAAVYERIDHMKVGHNQYSNAWFKGKNHAIHVFILLILFFS